MQAFAAYCILFTVFAVCAPNNRCFAAASPTSNAGANASEKTQGQKIHWGYDGMYGPSNWSLINENCGMKSQSPINIATSQTVLDDHLDEIILTASDSQNYATATNNGHTVNLMLKTTFRLSGGKLSSSYRVAGLHFHWGKNEESGSEHTINEKPYPLEMHIVSYDEVRYDAITDAMKEPKGLAVIGLLFQISPTDNQFLQALIDNLSQVAKAGNMTNVHSFDVKKLLPIRLTDYYRYSGSLTTPGCYESVIWTVLRNVSYVSKSQLDSFRNLQQDAHGDIIHKLDFNWRPTQPLNGRTVYRSFVNPSLMEGQAPIDDTQSNSATCAFSQGLIFSIGAALFSALFTAIRGS